jgi:glutathione S-transferase
MVPVDLTNGEQAQPSFRALNPFGRVPVFVDGDLTLWESHAILAYLGEKTGKLWPSDAAGRAQALKWLFFLSQHIPPPATDLAFNRVAANSRDARAMKRRSRAEKRRRQT